ncbi:hypothetical protein [Lyngbya sp. PCC 8106]|uniref:hypothetical protein n=1 Tax=Lyngbya sp. (strain PCC 8106) TaxID=313612 RepID=UPI0000EA9911|nr:hypothetical protein [Lyngbya sp. PCC 8106]EAW33381.1 hypothetical protein L8106_22776 [Lyngbya sp. PCC 8106]EAW35126.1 hypothetical protein L8106_13465 [Lyngbya sp. PCC 8106]
MNKSLFEAYFFTHHHKLPLSGEDVSKIKKMKVVISGSRSIQSLNAEMKSRLNKLIKLNSEILIGDAYGIDSLVQAYLYSCNYQKVTVFYSRVLRNNIGGWKTVNVLGGYTKRDIAMHSQADYALAIWDGKSRGTKRNIEQMKDKVRVVLG